eukprot:32711-Eustigmatos_ZCMA.PRE.1
MMPTRVLGRNMVPKLIMLMSSVLKAPCTPSCPALVLLPAVLARCSEDGCMPMEGSRGAEAGAVGPETMLTESCTESSPSAS